MEENIKFEERRIFFFNSREFLYIFYYDHLNDTIGHLQEWVSFHQIQFIARKCIERNIGKRFFSFFY